MDDRFKPLNLTDDDVLSFSNQTFKISQIKQRLQVGLNTLNSSGGYLSTFLDISNGQLPMKAASINWQSTILNG